MRPSENLLGSSATNISVGGKLMRWAVFSLLSLVLLSGHVFAQYSHDPYYSGVRVDLAREPLAYCVPVEYAARETTCNFVCRLRDRQDVEVCLLKDDDIRRYCVAGFRGTKPERDRLRECTGGGGQAKKSTGKQPGLSKEAREYFEKDKSSGMSTHDQVMTACARDRTVECRGEADDTFSTLQAPASRKAWLAECMAEAKILRTYCKAARSGASQSDLWKIHQQRKRQYAALEDIRIKAEQTAQRRRAEPKAARRAAMTGNCLTQPRSGGLGIESIRPAQDGCWVDHSDSTGRFTTFCSGSRKDRYAVCQAVAP